MSETIGALPGGARDAVRLLVTIGNDRTRGATGLEELLARARSALQMATQTAGDLAFAGHASGTDFAVLVERVS